MTTENIVVGNGAFAHYVQMNHFHIFQKYEFLSFVIIYFSCGKIKKIGEVKNKKHFYIF